MTAFSLEQALCENSSYHRGHLKARLLREGHLKNECSLCSQPPFWKGEPLVLVLDHINGVRNDHRFENLRLLCPNCNSQTPTFSGRNVRKKVKEPKFCSVCGCSTKTSTKCRKHASAGRGLKKIPTVEVMQELLQQFPATQVAKQLGVSDRTVLNWGKRLGIVGRTRGQWGRNQYTR